MALIHVSGNESYTLNRYSKDVDTAKEIGRRIRNARGTRKLREIAESTNGALSISQISNYEQGIRTPGAEEAKILARALGNITAAQILTVDDESTLLPDERTLILKYRSSDARGKDTIQSIADSQSDSKRAIKK